MGYKSYYNITYRSPVEVASTLLRNVLNVKDHTP